MENKGGSKEEAKWGCGLLSSRKRWQPFVAAWMSIRAKQREITRSWCPLSMTSCFLEPRPRAEKDTHTHMEEL